MMGVGATAVVIMLETSHKAGLEKGEWFVYLCGGAEVETGGAFAC